MILKHGSPNEFNEFKINQTHSMSIWGNGIYLSTNKYVAEKYSLKNDNNIGFIYDVYVADDITFLNIEEEVDYNLVIESLKYADVPSLQISILSNDIYTYSDLIGVMKDWYGGEADEPIKYLLEKTNTQGIHQLNAIARINGEEFEEGEVFVVYKENLAKIIFKEQICQKQNLTLTNRSNQRRLKM